jgi:predicted regulator of Ras-like GTPase activity (Roadblock/LC7/MglB family)
MPTIRDLVVALRRREGVEAAIILGPDGILIEGQALAGFDVDGIAAHVPGVLAAASALGAPTARGPLATAVLEHETGLVVVSVLSPDAVLVVLLQHSANLGQLLLELRRNREHIAALV